MQRPPKSPKRHFRGALFWFHEKNIRVLRRSIHIINQMGLWHVGPDCGMWGLTVVGPRLGVAAVRQINRQIANIHIERMQH